ncbi:branched-chain amino acid ABC transporter permease [Variovorax paradoxus]|nr:branched-chain amino acid ABC transporter permease [Variovorax paradoxus]MBT2301976.1 branched-chain amino acid ABC transporter permease [Variovorax paradoxus]
MPTSTTTPPVARARWKWPLIWGVLLVAGLFLPKAVASPFYLGLLVNGVILGIAAVGIGFLMHQCGFVMFGVAAFIGLPAYLVGIASNQLGMGVHAAVVFALAASTAFAALAGALVVRARPLPFAMLTLALAQMLRSTATLQVMRPLTGGDDGLPITFKGAFLGLSQNELAKATSFWPIVLVALAAVLFIAWRASNSRFGQVLRATQANEERMRFSGFNTYLPRLAAFTLASFLVSVSGVLLVLHSGFASAELLDFATGGHALVAMLVGGAASVAGPLLGALLYVLGQDAFGATGYLELLTGVAVVFMIAAFPKGASGFLLQLWRRATRKRSA